MAMNKKLLISYIVATCIVVVTVYIYKSHSVTKSELESVAAQNVVTTPQQENMPAVQSPQRSINENQELINKYTAQINAGEYDGGNTYYRRGLIYHNMQNYKLAIKDFTQALQLNNDSSFALYARALTYKQEGEFDKASNDLNAAIRLKPDFVDAYNLRGAVYEDQGNIENALADYNNAVAINPSFVQAYFNLGVIYAKQKKFTEAKAAFDNAIEHNSPAKDASEETIAVATKNLLQSYFSRAQVNLVTGNLQAAFADVNFVITHDSTNAEAYRLRSIIYDKLGDTASAANDAATADNLVIYNMLEHKR